MRRLALLSILLLAAELLNVAGVHAAQAEIQEVESLGFMVGTEQGFEPETVLTRAQIVTILWRVDGCPEACESAGFYDVDRNAWYAEPMSWAADHGIVFGCEGFAHPNDPMTREALSAILYRHSEEEYRVPGRVSIPEEVSSWAAIPFEWAAASNIMTPTDPQGFVSRGEMAVVLCDYWRFLNERERFL